MKLGLEGKIAVVAGGSRGCGRGISEELAQEGAKVLLSGRVHDKVDETVAHIKASGGIAAGVVADMTHKDGARAIIEAARTAFGDPDILVVNSPGPIPDPQSKRFRGFDNCADEDFLFAYQCFVMSVVYLTREVLPAMRQKKWGRLLNIGSIAMKNPHLEDPLPANDVRVAVNPLMKILSHENGRYGITANVIATGPFESELSRDYRASKPTTKTDEWYLNVLPVGRWGKPEEMGALAAFLCSERAAYLTGETIRLDGGYSKSLF